MGNKKSAKDMAFEKERAKFRQKIRDLEREIKEQKIKMFQLEEVANLKDKEIDEEITIHDLRTVPGVTHTKVIFDVVKPHKSKHSDEYLISYVSEKVNLYNNEFIFFIN